MMAIPFLGILGMLGFFAFAALVVVLIIFSFTQARKRREALGALAQRIGFTYDPSADYGHDEVYRHFSVFNSGSSRTAYNTLRGTVEIDGRPYPVKMGDYRYTVTSGTGRNRRSTTYNLSYLIAHTPFDRLPELFIRRENMIDRIAGAIGFDDIDFESEAFSRMFLVKSPSKRFAYDVIDPRMMGFLMDSDAPSIELERGRCLIHRGTRTWTPDQFVMNLNWIKAYFEHWPDHVLRTLDDQDRAGV